MVIKQNGFTLDPDHDFAKSMTHYAQSKGFPSVRGFHVTDPNGRQTYLLVDGQTPFYEHTSFESCCCRIDFMVLDRDVQ